MSVVHHTLFVRYGNIPDFPGYRVGDDGSVWSCWVRKKTPGAKGCSWQIDESRWRRMKTTVDRDGYLYVTLYRDGYHHTARVHVIVLTAFVGPCPEGMESCHYPDPDRTNCRLDNLQWNTHQENMRQRLENGRILNGSQITQSKLVESDIPEIFRLYASGLSAAEVARRYRVQPKCIFSILKRKSWRHVAVDPALVAAVEARLAYPFRCSENARTTPSIVREIRALRKSGVSLKDIGERFGLSRSYVGDIVQGKRRSHISDEAVTPIVPASS